ncbi:TetR/AcrR family transcriptional regulator [Deinococcus roseus]|uniref:TetR family transcriptional regulator n=1 Tax=Deinococcus roseus TaxID=392414 RepID=A0ABQ2CZF3_9DEIO|nr:TetR/AcrR family transcriptional regulator [Deinococcus roseus]GGJ36156.1 TetR family transcriptional regulator [Deinococcus roseus]
MTQRTARTPTQQRSRERQERILQASSELIAAHGSDLLRMAEVAQKAGIPIGSLYQYFPDKSSVIQALAERFIAEGQQCSQQELSQVKHPEDLPNALRRITEGYHQMYLAEPALRDIWGATQADKVLQQLDTQDIEVHAAMLCAVLERLYPGQPAADRSMPALVLMQLITATVRFALSFSPPQDRQVLETFQHMVVEPFCQQLAGPAS